MVRLPILASEKECFGCMLCADTCPKQAITIQENANGFWMPYIDSSLCVGCHLCEHKCKWCNLSHCRTNVNNLYTAGA